LALLIKESSEFVATAWPSVSCLIIPRCPSAIARFVVAIVVDTIKRVAFAWMRWHIVQEVFKLVPPITNDDSTATIIEKCLATRIVTAIKHRGPRFEHRTAGMAVSSEPDAVRSRRFTSKAAARFGHTISKSACVDGLGVAAIADAKPEAVATAHRVHGNNSQSSKALPTQINSHMQQP
jgi:hypothetical protein